MRIQCWIRIVDWSDYVKLPAEPPPLDHPDFTLGTLSLEKQHSADPSAMYELCIVFCSTMDTKQMRYVVSKKFSDENIEILDRHQAKIKFDTPPHEIYIKKLYGQLNTFLQLLEQAVDNHVKEELLYSNKLVVERSSEGTFTRAPRALEDISDTLDVLVLSGLHFSNFDTRILDLTKLTFLDLSDNALTYLPEEFNRLSNLWKLDISSNRMGLFPSSNWGWIKGNLINTLQRLSLHSNALKFFPMKVLKLRNLVHLDLSHNFIQSLPSGIVGIKNLKALLLAHNKLNCLPGSISNVRLDYLDVRENEFRPKDVHNVVPHTLPMRSLKEYAARKILEEQIAFSEESVPRSLFSYLVHESKFCKCGETCFDVHLEIQERVEWLRLSFITELAFGSCPDYRRLATECPIDSYFCSIKCYSSYGVKRSRPRMCMGTFGRIEEESEKIRECGIF